MHLARALVHVAHLVEVARAARQLAEVRGGAVADVPRRRRDEHLAHRGERELAVAGAAAHRVR
eukprot:3674617-Prymnesium_polylepis.1